LRPAVCFEHKKNFNRERALPYWADPAQTQPSEINHHYGGCGVYFEDPNTHLLEVITRPYGSVRFWHQADDVTPSTQ
jgi:hypothetical protein